MLPRQRANSGIILNQTIGRVELTVVIVSYNVKFYLEQCLISLRRALRGIEAEIFVVDNASTDGSVDYLAERFPDISLISSNHNLGFARANNIAIRQSTGRFVLLLNPDTIVGETVIRTVIDFLKTHDRVGGVGVRMMTDCGTDAKESRRGLPTPCTAFYKMSGLCARFPNSSRFAHYYMGHLSWDRSAEIEVVSGAFFAVQRTVIEEVGLLDEDYFMYGEDIDLSYRLLKNGYHNWYLPVRILHYKGESTQKSSFRYVHVFYSAMFIFFRKHYSGISLLLSLPIKTAIYFKAMLALIRMQAAKARNSLGFFSRRRPKPSRYIFIGQRESLERCRHIARKKGQEARFVERTGECPIDDLQNLEIPADEQLYLVYDTGTFAFEQIFAGFARHPRPNVCLGTFNPQTGLVITAAEVLQ